MCAPITPHGSHCLEAFRQDKCPPGLGRWPTGGGAIENIGPARVGPIKDVIKDKPSRATAASSHERQAVPAVMNVDSSIDPRPRTTPTPAPPPLPLRFNLRELLELESDGERVVWPSGFDSSVASAYIEDYNLAVEIGTLYAQSIEPEIEESTLTHVIRPPIEEAESQEPGPLPEVSGNVRNAITRMPLTPNVRPIRRCWPLSEYQSRQE